MLFVEIVSDYFEIGYPFPQGLASVGKVSDEGGLLYRENGDCFLLL